MSRKITIYSTKTKATQEITTPVTTWGELKPLVNSEMGVGNAKCMVRETRNTLENNEAVLPTGDFIVFVYPEKVKEYYGTGEKFGVKITYIYQDAPKGISHAVRLCKDFIGNDKFIVYLGDNVLRKNLIDYTKKFETSNSDAMILLCAVDEPQRFGIAELDKDNPGKIKKITEKKIRTGIILLKTILLVVFSFGFFEAFQDLLLCLFWVCFHVLLGEIFRFQQFVDRIAILVTYFLLVFTFNVTDIAAGFSSCSLEVVVHILTTEELIFPLLAEFANCHGRSRQHEARKKNCQSFHSIFSGGC